jgi:hypothetical protein
MDAPHYCTGCGEMHGGGARESDELKIAKVMADRDIEVARIQRGEARQAIEAGQETAELEAKTEVEIAAIEAETGVVAAEAVADAVAPQPAPEPEPPAEPVIVADDTEDETPPPPEVEKKAPKEHAGYWSGYSVS